MIQVQTHVDPLTGCKVPYTPRGRFVHIPPPVPRADFSNNFAVPWWKDDKYFVGILTTKARKIIITNMLTGQANTIEVGGCLKIEANFDRVELVLQVCREETMDQILVRYLTYNQHAKSYTWKHNGVLLDMAKTLEQNNIQDDSAAFHNLAIDGDHHLAEVQLYYNDDLTES